MKSGIVKVIPPAEWYARVWRSVCELPANASSGDSHYPISKKPSSLFESRTQSRKSLRASTVYTQARTLRSSVRTTSQSGVQSQMSRTTSRQLSVERHARAERRRPQRAQDPREPPRRPRMPPLHPSASPAALLVRDAPSRRNSMTTRITIPRSSTSHQHRRRQALKTRSQPDVVAESRRKTRQPGLVAANPGPRMRRSRSLLGD
jgi:hypothetical protein